jgi:hypothetical protein
LLYNQNSSHFKLIDRSEPALQGQMDPAAFAAMVEFMKEFLSSDRYAILASPKEQDVPIIDKKREAKLKKREAASELRRSVRAKIALTLRDQIIDPTLRKKKGKRKRKHTPVALDDSSDIDHEESIEEIRAQVLLSQRAKDLKYMNEIKILREQLESAQPVLPTRGKRSMSSASSILPTSPLVQLAPPSYGQQYYHGMSS